MNSNAVVRGAFAAAALILVATPRPGAGQTAPPSAPPAIQATGVPDDARFAIVESATLLLKRDKSVSESTRLLLRLDKFTGDVDRLVSRGEPAVAWQAVRRERNAKDNNPGDHRIHYQLVTAGGRSILLNIITGATWTLHGGEAGEEPYWKAFE